MLFYFVWHLIAPIGRIPISFGVHLFFFSFFKYNGFFFGIVNVIRYFNVLVDFLHAFYELQLNVDSNKGTFFKTFSRFTWQYENKWNSLHDPYWKYHQWPCRNGGENNKTKINGCHDSKELVKWVACLRGTTIPLFYFIFIAFTQWAFVLRLLYFYSYFFDTVNVPKINNWNYY